MKKSEISMSLVLHFISLVIIFESLFMLLAVGVSLVYKERILPQMADSFLVTILFGMILFLGTRQKRYMEPSKKESFVIVTFSWIIMGLVGTIPYLFTNSIPEFSNSFFESISGFTTTGSSVLVDIESLPKSILFWRAETHWIGGMGIIVLVVAIMPFLRIHGIYLFYSETSSVVNEKVSTKIKTVARNLWLIYVGLTVAETIILNLGGMSFFDSVCHSFATVATGGFSTQNDSISGYSPFIQYTIIVFMFLSGINFCVHVLIMQGKLRKAFSNEEFRMYVRIIIVLGILVTAFLLWQQKDLGIEAAFRTSIFQVVSIFTATGFATADYLQWPVQVIGLIALLMLIGPSSGSTGGGVKVIRYLIAFRRIKQSFRQMIYPKTVNIVRYNGCLVKDEYARRVVTFIIFYYLIVLLGTMVMLLWTNNPGTSFGAVATSMAGVGPGFGTIGPANNFLHLPTGAKYFLTILMLIGRLEIYSVLVLFSKSFWLD